MIKLAYADLYRRSREFLRLYAYVLVRTKTVAAAPCNVVLYKFSGEITRVNIYRVMFSPDTTGPLSITIGNTKLCAVR